MTHLFSRSLLSAACSFALVFVARAEDPIDQVATKAVAEYSQRLQAATQELNDTRQRIIKEQQPLADTTRKLENQVMALEGEISQLEESSAQRAERKQQLLRDSGNFRKNFNYLTALTQDAMKTANDSLLPGESAMQSDALQALGQKLDDAARATDPSGINESVDFLLARLTQQIGGYTAPGSSLIGSDNRLVKGTFAFVGPESFFKSDAGPAGTVRAREGSTYAATYPFGSWQAPAANAFFNGENGTFFADASGGKALRLKEINGSIAQHIERGGVVAYLIIAVGVFALLIMLQKVGDLLRFGIDSPRRIEQALTVVRRGSKPEIEATIIDLKKTTQQVFATGLRHFDKPKQILEEHLFALTLQLRLHYERRLPLLAVIATAAPLMGLLGTVMGMVKTFALITVFGTGNAGKLSGGISEVLVTTELGLMVAVPALIAHGFLAHRIQKNLSMLDRYAVEFVTAAEEAKNPSLSDEAVPA